MYPLKVAGSRNGPREATEYLVRGNLPLEDLPPEMRRLPHVGQRTIVVGVGDTGTQERYGSFIARAALRSAYTPRKRVSNLSG